MGRRRQFTVWLRPWCAAWSVVLSLALAVPCAIAAAKDAAPLSRIAEVVNEQIAQRHIPGAVVLAGVDGRVMYRRAFGNRMLNPRRRPMSVGTVFDLASLTKVVATTTAVMQLVEQGRIRLDAPVAVYWPAFAEGGKASITVRELLTHYSGLPPDLPLGGKWAGEAGARRIIPAVRPVSAPGTKFAYSDINFDVLAELVRRVSGEPFQNYCESHIFKPIGMSDTRFDPPRSWRRRIAPEDFEHGKLVWGRVQDPVAARMGGVSGHAGLFSTANDLARFAQMLLDGGRARGHQILRPATIHAMTTPQSPAGHAALRGLGWDIDSAYAKTLAPAFSPRSFGHTGYTGTALWIDPASRSFLIILTNRLHPHGSGSVTELRRRISELVGEMRTGVREQAHHRLASSLPVKKAEARTSDGTPLHLRLGIDVLQALGFHRLAGLRIGLISNDAARDSQGRRTIDVLRDARRVRLAALFSPEHGLRAGAHGRVASGADPATGLPVYSLYGTHLRPTDRMLKGLDALVFDVQDVGVRYYTYATTMAYAMEAAARKGLQFYVLDRPDPIDAGIVQGPVLDRNLTSFVGYMPMPTRYGMTIGELARMFNVQRHIGVKLHVVEMRGYRRDLWYRDTGLKWFAPSPNLRTAREAVLYPAVGMVEGANVSVGRGTDTPFEVLGAPWIDAAQLAHYLGSRRIAGVRFTPASFTPAASTYAGRLCRGVRIRVTDRDELDTPLLGVEIIAALHRLYGRDFEIDGTLGLVGSRATLDAILKGDDPTEIARAWKAPLNAFVKLRRHFLLY